MTDDVPELGPLPDTFASTRDALHQLAFFVLAPRRYDHAGRLGLTATPGGVGTPWFEVGSGWERVRTERDLLVVETADAPDATPAERRDTRPTSVRDACAFVGIEYRTTWFEDFHDPLAPWDPDRPVDVDAEAAAALADWFAFGTAALERLRATPGAVDPSPVQLWPEHFDPATELGSTDDGTRASYGASPGDADHDGPYLYVAPWTAPDAHEYWDDDAFGGASLSHAALLAADDQLATAVEFLRRGSALLDG